MKVVGKGEGSGEGRGRGSQPSGDGRGKLWVGDGEGELRLRKVWANGELSHAWHGIGAPVALGVETLVTLQALCSKNK